MSFGRIFPCSWLVIALLAGALRGDDASDRAQDIAQMKRVWEALMAHQKENGNLPDRLGALVPKYLTDSKVLISPRHPRKDPNNANAEGKYPTSYFYDWGQQQFGDLTLTEIKTCQIEEFGPVVPVLRCALYEQTLHISHAGDFYEAKGPWEFSPLVKEIIAKRGLGPGASKGRFLELTTVDPVGAPVSGVKVRVQNRYVQTLRLPWRRFTMGDDGVVRVPFGPVESMKGLLTFEKPGHFAFSESAERTAFPNTLRVIVSPIKWVAGVVTDAKRKPVVNATVHFARQPDKVDLTGEWSERLRVQMLGPNHVGKAVTDQDGKWTIAPFPDDPHLKVKCTVSHPDFAVRVQILDRAALERDGYFSGEVKLTLAEPFQVRGQVINPDGSPASEAAIVWSSVFDPLSEAKTLKPIETKTNAAGEFEIWARLPERAKIVVLPKAGGAPLLYGLMASPAMPLVKLQLGVGRILKGKVVSQQSRPIADLPILFSGWAESFVPLPAMPIVAVTDADGNWTWEGAPKENVNGRVALPSGEFFGWAEQGGRQMVVVRIWE